MKRFNVTGVCVPAMHYMINTDKKLNKMLKYIEYGDYFYIIKPRQYGKTTTLFLFEQLLNKDEIYTVFSISFEGMGDEIFLDEALFSKGFLNELAQIQLYEGTEIAKKILNEVENCNNLSDLSSSITRIIKNQNKKVILIIDEVDKSSNNQLFVSFLGVLRDKYLKRNQGKDFTFFSVILAGVHDVKTLRIKIRPDEEHKYNSPWNIATNVDVDFTFKPEEIVTMLDDYQEETKIKMDEKGISERIYYFTSGHPFLVSRVCKEIDEKILPQRDNKNWVVEDVDDAVKNILNEQNTNFEDLIKNLENNNELLGFITNLVIGRREYNFVALAPLINLGITFGIISERNSKVVIQNKIYEEYITNYLTAKKDFYADSSIFGNSIQSIYLDENGRLLMDKVLLKFQEVIKEKYSQSEILKSDEFLEKDLRLLFLVFLKPIINGVGFSYKEVEIGAERRLDIIVIFRDEKFIIELKLWYGQKYHNEGKIRLKKYMINEGVNKGYMLIMHKNKEKAFTVETEDDILMVWV
ncbi:MAG: AAA family ATPase [bacterium]